MGQQQSRTSNAIYFRQKLPSFLSSRKQNNAQIPEEPIKFQYKVPNKSCSEKNKKTQRFGLDTIRNLKSVLDDVRSECNGLKGCVNLGKSKGTCVESEEKKSTKTKHKLNYSKPNQQLLEKNSKPSAITTENNSIVVSQLRRIISSKSDHVHKKREDRKIIKKIPVRTKSVPNLKSGSRRERVKYKRNNGNRSEKVWKRQQFGYDIQDVDQFLAKATLSKPANIPVVLAFSSALYQTRSGGYQTELSLPLGMVVNAIFKNQNWLYVQTPHAEEGYVSYSACLPLGIIPASEEDNHVSPCWEKSTDVFPKPSGNMTDTEKLSCHSDNDNEVHSTRAKYRTAFSICGEKSVDRLYLRAAAIAKGKCTRHTLLIITQDYTAVGKECLSVSKNEVVFLLNVNIKGWFYVKNKEGRQGYIPSVIAGHGFL